MDCKREGKIGCIWWVAGCLDPEVSPNIKKVCAKEGWHETNQTDAVRYSGQAVQR